MKDKLIEIGFNEIPHYTVMDSFIYDLGRNRQLSFGCIGTPNEMLWICELDVDDNKQINELICIKNYDYDGFTDIKTIKDIINSITGRKI